MIDPLEDRVLVVVSKPTRESPGGIIIPDNAQSVSQHGEVLEVGPGKPMENGTWADMYIAKGDLVILPKYGGYDVEIHGREFKLLRQTEVLAVVRP